MIYYIRGLLTQKEVTFVSIEAHGVGYGVSIPLSTYESLPEQGQEVLLYIHYHIREDAHKLFGFFTRTEREVFRLLIGITKIGPKVGLSILSGIAIPELIASVNSGEYARLEKVPGLGAKTAQRLVMELKGKLGPVPVGTVMQSTSGTNKRSSSAAFDEAFAAMVSLGYNDKQVQKAFSRVEESVAKDAPVEEWIRKALQII
mgnify:FL=1